MIKIYAEVGKIRVNVRVVTWDKGEYMGGDLE